jgi:putative salt-induced outer membrane protein YdiY
MKHTLLRFLASALIALAFTCAAIADRIELTDGSVVNGKLLSAEKGLFRFETKFAGMMTIAQEQIKSFQTDEVVNVGLKAGTQVLGTVAPGSAGIVVTAPDGQMSAPPANIVAIWRPGEDSPEMREIKATAEKMKRRWAYEASAAINGRTGGSEKFSGALGFKATLESPDDKLMFNAAINRAEENGNKTADDWRAGVDYSALFTGKAVWYARTELSKDKIKNINLRSNSAFGIGRKLRNTEQHDLEVRVGLGYIYETYTGATPDFNSAGLDLALLNRQAIGWATMNNTLTYTPSFKDFANYRVLHETTFDLPIKSGDFWKLRMGVNNDYQSEPAGNAAKLDTTYFTALILNWK